MRGVPLWRGSGGGFPKNYRPQLFKPDSSEKFFCQAERSRSPKNLKRIAGLKKRRTTDTHFLKRES